MEYFFTNLL